MTDRVSRSRRDHATLSLGLIEVARRLYSCVDEGDSAWMEARNELQRFYERHLAPHMTAEENRLFEEADANPDTGLLANALRAQHRALEARVSEMGDADTGLGAVAAARAVHALFALHVLQVDDHLLPAMNLKTTAPPSRPEPPLLAAPHSHR